MRLFIAFIVAVTSIANVAIAQEPLAVSLQRLTVDTTNRIATAAIASCRKEGIHITVTVVDRNGIVQTVMRDTLAAPVSVDISRMKAYTAVNFNAVTSQLTERADTPIGRIDGLVMSGGGIPIRGAGMILGGIGVSGAPGGDIDERCAQAGLDAISEDLEMEL